MGKLRESTVPFSRVERYSHLDDPELEERVQSLAVKYNSTATIRRCNVCGYTLVHCDCPPPATTHDPQDQRQAAI